MHKNSRFVLSILGTIFCTILEGAPPPLSSQNGSYRSVVAQQTQITLQDIEERVRNHQTDLDVCYERLQQLESNLGDLQGGQLHTSSKNSTLERVLDQRIAALEIIQESLIKDFKSLKAHLNDTTSALTQCQRKIDHIDTQLSTDITLLKKSIQSMLALMQSDKAQTDKILSCQEGAMYIVKTGDSLGQIAIDHKTDIKTIKHLNQLSSDTIYPGQKLLLP